VFVVFVIIDERLVVRHERRLLRLRSWCSLAAHAADASFAVGVLIGHDVRLADTAAAHWCFDAVSLPSVGLLPPSIGLEKVSHR